MSKPTGDSGDLVNGDHERDLGTHGRYTTLRAQLTAEGYIAISLAEGLRRIEAVTEKNARRREIRRLAEIRAEEISNGTLRLGELTKTDHDLCWEQAEREYERTA